MKTQKILFFTIAFLAFSFISTAQRGVRIGYIDMEYILESVPEYKEATVQLEGKVQRWKKDIDKNQKEIDQMKLNLSNERVLLTKELIDEREEEIKIKEDEMLQYQQDRFGPNGDLFIQKKQLIQPIQDQVFNIVQEVAEDKKYDFIFDKSADVVMLFAAKRNDISDYVLRSIERAGRRVQAADKKDQRELERLNKQESEEDEEPITAQEKILAEKNEERQEVIQDKKDERQKMIEDRQRQRDSIREVKKAEFEERRQRLLDERQQRKDSIIESRENKN